MTDAGGSRPLLGREPRGGDLDGGGHEDGTSDAIYEGSEVTEDGEATERWKPERETSA